MSRGYNFSSGPAALPLPVLQQAQAELLEWGGERASLRSPPAEPRSLTLTLFPVLSRPS